MRVLDILLLVKCLVRISSFDKSQWEMVLSNVTDHILPGDRSIIRGKCEQTTMSLTFADYDANIPEEAK